MGTRSITVVYDEYNDKPVVCMYRQFDGYPSGHGRELAEILKDRVIVNGFGLNEKTKVSNGMGCLAATIVASFKTEIGGFYLYPYAVKGQNNFDQEYEYHVRQGTITVVRAYTDGIMFEGTWNEFYEFCLKDE